MTTESQFVQILNTCLKSLSSETLLRPPGVIQIGAGDGTTGDHLCHFLKTSACRALLFEPVSHVFQKLCRTYQNYPSVRCRQQAVSDTEGEKILYRIQDVAGLPWWADQLASFDPNVILSHSELIPDLAARIIGETITTVTPLTLVEEFGHDQIDILATDTEGHDDVILTAFLNAACFPRMILFEHKHLSDARYDLLTMQLRESEYEVSQGTYDTLCIRGGFSSLLDSTGRQGT